MSDFTTIVIDCLRHGRCEGPDRTLRGRTDVALTPEGRAAMKAAAGHIGRPDRIVTSPLRRCREVAEGLAVECGAPCTLLDEAMEMDFGAWDGVPTETLLARSRRELESFWQDPGQQTPPGGERYNVFLSRTASAWQTLLHLGLKTAGKGSDGSGAKAPCHLLVCGHAGVIKSWAAASLGLSTAKAQYLYRLHLPYAGLMRFRIDIDRRSEERFEQLRFAGVLHHPLSVDE